MFVSMPPHDCAFYRPFPVPVLSLFLCTPPIDIFILDSWSTFVHVSLCTSIGISFCLSVVSILSFFCPGPVPISRCYKILLLICNWIMGTDIQLLYFTGGTGMYSYLLMNLVRTPSPNWDLQNPSIFITRSANFFSFRYSTFPRLLCFLSAVQLGRGGGGVGGTLSFIYNSK